MELVLNRVFAGLGATASSGDGGGSSYRACSWFRHASHQLNGKREQGVFIGGWRPEASSSEQRYRRFRRHQGCDLCRVTGCDQVTIAGHHSRLGSSFRWICRVLNVVCCCAGFCASRHEVPACARIQSGYPGKDTGWDSVLSADCLSETPFHSAEAGHGDAWSTALSYKKAGRGGCRL